MSSERERPHLEDPQLTVTWPVELFPDDRPDEPVDAVVRCAHVDVASRRIYLPGDFIGRRMIRAAADSPLCPRGNIPVCSVAGHICFALDWLEQALPEYAGMWAQLHRQVGWSGLLGPEDEEPRP
jgi:hypothetical protein